MADTGDELTVTEAIASLRSRGYTSEFQVSRSGRILCAACVHLHEAADLVVEATARIEGASDPDDEAVVFGAMCQRCSTRGVLVVAYGPAASTEDATVLTSLRDRDHRSTSATATHPQTCPRCGEEFLGPPDVVVEAVVAHAEHAHGHRLDRDIVRAHLEGRHPFKDEAP